MFILSECNPIFNPSYSPTRQLHPSSGSTVLNQAWTMEDLPAPVLPTIPTFSQSLMLKETDFNTCGNYGLYFIVKFSISIVADGGHLFCDYADNGRVMLFFSSYKV